ncbi:MULTISPECIES: TRAP transporter large permease [unclassified Marinobacter]|jgi:tripartite ATP-independent transporter DctM subunit|uniref:TRAP transporter large permease n=1 Tax=unclassified Marinobacter TaxID=83889 RepID=UPI0020102CFA|nr:MULTISPECIES: TRAP transporter large permease [unclassified Marinobacter]MCL1481443.1 TRAP transporter large permease [Marinobacter sp.]UQG54510.1 TRAP transporter large permease [Marinobacter sp. M4C]UQG63315.1 TRAP transporter large permease [Marinobacter sp. M2C]UQG67595.1 TRAP transporter large permease [Marinobacter sp. M1C]
MVATSFLTLLFIGLPIALVLAITAMIYIYLSGNSVLFLSYPQQFFGGLENYGLLAIPLFMLVGELMNEGGITRRLVSFASVFLGSVRGGLAYINIIANMMMASIVGSANAQVAVMGQVMVPEMHRQGYDRGFATATTAAGALLAPVIPPSMLFIIFGVLAQISIGDLFLAGVVPGLMMAASFIIIIALLGLRYQYPASARLTRAQKMKNILAGMPSLSVPVVMIGGILGGFTTPTESAAVGAAMAAVVGRFAHKEMKFERMGGMLLRVGINTGVVLAMVAAAAVFGWVIVYEMIPQQLSDLILGMTSDPFVYLLLVMGLLLLVGMVIDGIAALILLVPILLPVAESVYGINPYHLGVLMCINLTLGLFTPPVGAALFVASRVTGCTPGQIFRPLSPFLLSTILIMVLIAWQPELATWLVSD